MHSRSPRSSTLRGVWFALGLAVSALTSGCGHHFAIAAPADFAELDPGRQEARGYAYRATTADGVVLAVREIDNDRHANSAFWIQAVKNRVRDLGGYALLAESDVRSADGTAGHQLRFGRDEGNHTYDYWLTLYVTHDRIFVVEAGGERSLFEAERAAVESAIAAFRAS